MERITSIDDPRVEAYRNLRDRTLRGESIFLAEGELVAERLLASQYGAESLLVSDQFAEKFQRLAADRVPVYVGRESLLKEIVGFNFHRGVLAVGRRPARYRRLDELMRPLELAKTLSLVICPEVTKPDNLGLIFRSAGALGIDGVILGDRCCDPFSRRTLRVSMGASLHVPFIRSPDLVADLRCLRSRWGVELLGTVLDPKAERLAELRWPPRAGVLMGNETAGLGHECLGLCDRLVTIPMHPEVDSLNLGVAASVFLYDLTVKRSTDPNPQKTSE
jgi:tRNA G18 (ribose-2'-O)-methylase SpoU